MLEWISRCTVRRKATGDFHRWRATNGPYVVVKVHSKLGLPDRWLAICTNGREEILSSHKLRRRAEQSCNQHSRRRGR